MDICRKPVDPNLICVLPADHGGRHSALRLAKKYPKSDGAMIEGENKALDMKAWFLREVERRAGASKEEMLRNLDGTTLTLPIKWLRRILGETP